MTEKQEVRVRIAPSPTGDPHVGTAYVALFNMALARKHGGKFILRIEDTDQARAKASSEAQIESNLAWLGLSPDEGPSQGGPYGPYRQSERTAIYLEHCEHLLAKGAAYHCFCTAERLNEVRERQRQNKETTGYDRHCRDLAPQSLAQRISEGTPYVVRMKMPLDGTISFVDELRGRIEIKAQQLDDQVILKTDGFPTYHLANVVDDHLMKISHVMRAEEWISSTPKHVMLYEAFGWERPKFIHLPLLRNVDKSKISKRKNPVSIEYYRRAGILPEALVNFLALMGFSYGEDREEFRLDEMISVFDLKKISLGDPVFDLQKLTWLNQIYMHKMSPEQFAEHLLREVFTKEALCKLQPVALERMSRFEQFVDNNDFFFNGALNYSQVSLIPKGKENSEVVKMVKGLAEKFDDLYVWQVSEIESLLKEYREEVNWKPRDFFMTIRLIVTGRKDSPPLNESIELIGREMVRFRLRDSLKVIAAAQ